MTRSYSTVAVIGLGTIGSGIAAALVGAGMRVVAVESGTQALTRGREITRAAVDRGAGQEADPLDRLALTTSLEDIAGADLVIEAVPEKLPLKTDIARRVNKLCAPEAVFVTTTTALPISDIARAAGRVNRTVGLHMPGGVREGAVVELACTPFTDPGVKEDMTGLVESLSWTPVHVGDRAGFIGGALIMGYLNAAAAMFEQRYASRDDIDIAMMLGCGLPLGPLAQLDHMGLDVALDTLRALYERTADRQYLPAPILGHMVSAGLLGRKSGDGFYAYHADGSSGVGAITDDGPRYRPATTRPIRRIGVIGTGTMAAGIAEVCARTGHPTTIVGRAEAKIKDALTRIDRSLHKAAKRGVIAAAEPSASLARLLGSCDLAALGDCDLVIEAVAEDLDVKRQIFTEMDKVCRPGALLSTTTSSLPVIECAVSTERPEDVVGLHFFNPASRMKLVEIVRTVRTADSSAATAQQACAQFGKRAVNCTDRSGFIVNALLFPYLNRAASILHEGYATEADMETVMKQGWNHPMGPLRLLDAIGLDISLAIQRRLYEAFREPALIPAASIEYLVMSGHLGEKTGKGFRVYNPA